MDHLVADIPQKALIQHEGKVLLVKNTKGRWELPGGRLAKGESPVDGLKREIKEELNADIKPIQVYGTYVFESFGTTHFVVVYLFELITEVNSLTVDGRENIEMVWVGEGEFAHMSLEKTYTEEVLQKFFSSERS